MSRRWLLFALDLVIVAIAPFVALSLRYDFAPEWGRVVNIVPYTCIGVPVSAAAFFFTKTHQSPWRHVSVPDVLRIALASALAIMLTTFIVFLTKSLAVIPRSVLPLQWGLIVGAMVSMRLCARLRARRRSGFTYDTTERREKEGILVVGRNQVAELYLRCVECLAGDVVAVMGILDERTHDVGKRFHTVKVIGHPTELPLLLKSFEVHCVRITRVVVAIKFDKLSDASREVLIEQERLKRVILDPFFDAFAERLGLDHQLHARGAGDRNGSILDGDLLRSYGIESPPRTYNRLKRAIDCSAAIIAIILLSPIIALVALLVALDVGSPILFWQQRLGQGGRPFKLIKFRTMGPGVDQFGNSLADEQRLSAIGRLLRRMRMDELPQLYNILAGEMSFVGPRPLRATRQPKNGEVRLCVRPGVTGWAQVNGGQAIADHLKLALDVWYLRRASLSLDIKIILRSFLTVIRGDKVRWSAIEAAQREFKMLSRREGVLQLENSRKVA